MTRIARNALTGWAVAILGTYWLVAPFLPATIISGGISLMLFAAASATLYRWLPSALHYLLDKHGEPDIQGDLLSLIGIATLALGVFYSGIYGGIYMLWDYPAHWNGTSFSNFGRFMTALGLFLFYRSSSVGAARVYPPNWKWVVGIAIVTLMLGIFIGSKWQAGPEVGASFPAPLPDGLACVDPHLVKGNTGKGGERIFHVPGGRSYAGTRPDVCFRSPSHAEIAGYRAAR